MQTKPQAPNAKVSTTSGQATKAVPNKHPQPLDTKVLQQVGGGAGFPRGTW
jgi:hypothetical protein